MSSRFLLFLASAGAAASLQAQGMAVGFPFLVSGASPLSAGRGPTGPAVVEGLALDSPEAEACLASARRFKDLWAKHDAEGVFRWLPASRQESVRRIVGAFFTQFDAEVADEAAGLMSETGAALKGNADLLLRTMREKWAEICPATSDSGKLTAERIAAAGDWLFGLAALSRADLAQGRVEALFGRLGSGFAAIAGEPEVYDGVSLEQEILGVRSSAADGSFGLETRICFGGDAMAIAFTNEVRMVLVEGVWAPATMMESWTDETTERVVTEQIPELMSELAAQRDQALVQIRRARDAARRMAAAGTIEEMDAAGRAFAKAAFSVGGDEDVPEIPDQP